MIIDNILKSKDNTTTKYQIKLNDNNIIETVYVDYYNKHIICFSTQVGCIMGCKMCNNGINSEYVRNLSSEEIIEQCKIVVKNSNIDLFDKPILFSAMGVGEPLLNIPNLAGAINELSKFYNNSKFAMATTAVYPKKIIDLIKLIDPINLKITISLHAPNDEIRKNIIPKLKNIKQILEMRKLYIETYNKDFEWNYVLFNNLNDSEKHARELAAVLGSNSNVKINKFNSIDNCQFKESPASNRKKFINTLKEQGLNVEFYQTNGSDILGACGQMRVKTKTLDRV